MSARANLEVQSSLAQLRRQRGISAAHLAAAVGISRQTVYAIESGTYVPNTAVALKLARTLDVGVEQLFSLEERSPVRRSTLKTFSYFQEQTMHSRGKLCSCAPWMADSWPLLPNPVLAVCPKLMPFRWAPFTIGRG